MTGTYHSYWTCKKMNVFELKIIWMSNTHESIPDSYTDIVWCRGIIVTCIQIECFIGWVKSPFFWIVQMFKFSWHIPIVAPSGFGSPWFSITCRITEWWSAYSCPNSSWLRIVWITSCWISRILKIHGHGRYHISPVNKYLGDIIHTSHYFSRNVIKIYYSLINTNARSIVQSMWIWTHPIRIIVIESYSAIDNHLFARIRFKNNFFIFFKKSSLHTIWWAIHCFINIDSIFDEQLGVSSFADINVVSGCHII